jgi:transcriptional regulator with XRE-family HTH domain
MRYDSFEALRDFIIKTRTDRGLSQADVAKRGGIPKGTIGAIEAGRRAVPRQETLQGIAKGLGVPYDVLDRLARGLSLEGPIEPPMALGKREQAILDQIDGLELSEHHRRALRETVRVLLLEMQAEERSRQ